MESIKGCFSPSDLSSSSPNDNPPYVPHINYAAFDKDDDGSTPPPDYMTLYPLHVFGSREERVNLMFFSDGCESYSPEARLTYFYLHPIPTDTVGEEEKFVKDASKLKDDIVSHGGAMSHVAHLLNVWATFVPSNGVSQIKTPFFTVLTLMHLIEKSGIGSHDRPLEGASFGLYRPGAELRAVFVNNPRRARAACRWFRENKAKQGGCDQPILLGKQHLRSYLY